MEQLRNQVAVITGASSGLGEAMARKFVAEGARVVLTARRGDLLDKLAAQLGERATVLPGDVTHASHCAALMDQTVERHGRLDILVNNAGISDHHTTTVHASDALWDANVAVNQSAVFYCCRAALPHMERQGSGVILNVSAIAGVYGNAGVSYSAAKAAVGGITKNIAIQYAGRGIRCNAIAPGPTATSRMSDTPAQRYDQAFQAITERHMDTTVPPAQVEDQIAVALFLVSDAARAVNGQILVVDNGMCL